MMFGTENQEAHLLGARTGDVAALRIIGRATFKISGEFRDFGLAAVHERERSLILDFSECTSVDSTILGVIAMIGLEGRGSTALVAVNANPPVRNQLQGVGLSKLLRFADTDADQMDWSGLCAAAAGSVETDAVSETMLAAHETLMNLDERNIPVFRDVVELLKQQKQSTQSKS